MYPPISTTGQPEADKEGKDNTQTFVRSLMDLRGAQISMSRQRLAMLMQHISESDGIGFPDLRSPSQ